MIQDQTHNAIGCLPFDVGVEKLNKNEEEND